MKNILIGVIGLLIVVAGVYYYTTRDNEVPPYQKPGVETPAVVTPEATSTNPVSDTNPETPIEKRAEMTVIGKSVNGEDIVAYHFGDGDKEALFIGGTHGGYSWNTSLLAYELIDWLKKSPSTIPDEVSVTIIPTLNPDGLKKITGQSGSFTAADVSGTEADKTAARFNENDVDLNRNFDCEWKAVGTWQNKNVSGGSEPFSEPETKTLRDYVAKYEPTAVVAWYSAAGGVYTSSCGEDVLLGSKNMTGVFAKASGYTAYEEFDNYEITGDMVNWFAKENIPAISVLLTDHKSTELAKNKAGVEAIIKYLSE